MLSKKHKLNLSKQAERDIFKHRVLDSSGLRYFAHPNCKKKFKAAVIVPKKVFAKASVRNNVRRKIYQIIANHKISSYPINLVLLVQTKKKEINKIEQDLDKILVKYKHL